MATEDGSAVEEFELAAARLDWVRTDRCLDLPAQRAALEWHVACCEAALAAVDRKADKERGHESASS